MSAKPERELKFGCPNLGDRDLFDELVDQIFERKWLTNNGIVVQEFEQMLCKYLGVKHCIPVCNATIGLQVACHALDLSGEIVMPAFTFIATPHAARWIGLAPTFADVDPQTHTIDPASIERCITPKTSAIMGVHVWGNSCDVDSIHDIARKHDLKIIYDAAHAFGCANRSGMIGNFGNCEVFSFHATKFFNTFEGGAIATNDDELANRLRKITNFGFSGTDCVEHLGTNAKMSEISAAMGISVFASLDRILSHNRQNYFKYVERLGSLEGVRLIPYSDQLRSNWQYVVVEIDESKFGVSRDQVMAYLHTAGIGARRYFYPGCHNAEPYRHSITHENLPVTERLCDAVLCLPTGSSICPDNIDEICDSIIETQKFSEKSSTLQ